MDKTDKLDVGNVVRDDLGEFWEMPSVPFLDSHGELVQVLFDLIEEGDSLDDVLVLSGDVSSDFTSGERVTQTKGDLDQVLFGQIYNN